MEKSSKDSQIDSSNPLFMHTSDSPGLLLVSKQFDGSGFNAWKRRMIIALSAKNKLGFIDGTVSTPKKDSSDFSARSRCNFMVISWILNALTKEIAESVIYLSTAQEIWTELLERFEQNDNRCLHVLSFHERQDFEQANGTMIFQIQRELFSISQENDIVSSYYTRIKRIWDELRTYQTFPDCSCESAKTLGKYFEDQKLFQFLMGLNESFNAVRGHILLMSPLPSVNRAYSMLVHEEKQREISVPTALLANDTAAMYVGNQKNNHNGSWLEQSKRTTIICNYCKKSGHTKDKCYKLHGFPTGFKFQQGKKLSGAAQTRAPPSQVHVLDNLQHPVQSQSLPSIFSEQYNHLVTLLSQFKPAG